MSVPICGPRRKRRILQLRRRCYRIRQIASKVGVSRSTVWRVLHSSSLDSLEKQRTFRFRSPKTGKPT